jgi:hypothetical protein
MVTYSDQEIEARLYEADYSHNDAVIKSVIRQIRQLGQPAEQAFEDWWKTGKVPTFDIEGITSAFCRRMHHMNDVALILTYDQLNKNPKRAAYFLKRPVILNGKP